LNNFLFITPHPRPLPQGERGFWVDIIQSLFGAEGTEAAEK
jgi:hypothetical protein